MAHMAPFLFDEYKAYVAIEGGLSRLFRRTRRGCCGREEESRSSYPAKEGTRACERNNRGLLERSKKCKCKQVTR